MRERMRYRFDNTMSKGTHALIGLLTITSLLLIMFVGALAAVFTDEDPARTLWMSMLRTLDPGTMADDEGGGVFLFLMLTVTIGGIFVVAALIGVLNAGLESRLDELRKGRSRVVESGHTVVLGWSEQVFTVVSELVLANEIKPRSCVAILADTLQPPSYGVTINPDKRQPFVFQADDQVIVLSRGEGNDRRR